MSCDYHDEERRAAALAAGLIAGHRLKWRNALDEVFRDTGIRPTESLVASEIRRWFDCFDRDGHRETLRRKREAALVVMRSLREWHPFITGHVLSGAATDDTAVELLILTEDEKGVELSLLSLGVDFEVLDFEVRGRHSRISLLIECREENIILTVENASNSVKSIPPDEWQRPLEAKLRLDENGLKTLLNED